MPASSTASSMAGSSSPAEPPAVAGAAEAPEKPTTTLKMRVKKWRPVAIWKWKVDEEVCTICQNQFDGICPDCKFPGDDCPPIWGKCNHPFHFHCMIKWLKSHNGQEQCPLCRAPWEFKGT